MARVFFAIKAKSTSVLRLVRRKETGHTNRERLAPLLKVLANQQGVGLFNLLRRSLVIRGYGVVGEWEMAPILEWNSRGHISQVCVGAVEVRRDVGLR